MLNQQQSIAFIFWLMPRHLLVLLLLPLFVATKKAAPTFQRKLMRLFLKYKFTQAISRRRYRMMTLVLG